MAGVHGRIAREVGDRVGAGAEDIEVAEKFVRMKEADGLAEFVDGGCDMLMCGGRDAGRCWRMKCGSGG